MKRILWLDDIRCPYVFNWNTLIWNSIGKFLADTTIMWVRSYNEFVDNIEKCEELPIAIFFDHDLGEPKSGMDCMKWLVNYMQDNNIDPNNVGVYFQSQNPVGRENMASLFSNYVRFYNSNK